MKMYLFAAAAAMTLASASIAQASTLFYSGDFDGGNPNANGLANERDVVVSDAATYQNFTVSGGVWHVTGLFTNNLSTLNPSTAAWEIRTGVSQGNGGSVLFSGTSAVQQSATGRSGFGLTEVQDLVSVSFDLNPGVYWMSVTPVSLGEEGRSFNTNTFGANAIGVNTANAQYFNSSFFGSNFANANNNGNFPAFSDGVIGSAGGAVPEPATWALMIGGFGLAGVSLRRRRLAIAA